MSRVYYREPKLHNESTPLSRFDDADFRQVMRLSNPNHPIIELPTASSLKFWSNANKRFKYAIVWSDAKDISTPDLGLFYSPQSVIFFDNNDFYFPSYYCFVAMIEGKLEARKCHAGEGVKWLEIADIHQPVVDEELLQKIENSLLALKEMAVES